MGEKGARRSDAGTAMAATLVDDLSPLGDVTQRAMFGGHGIFADGVMFGLVDSEGTAFLRADDDSPSDGSVRHGRMPYWSVPDELLDAPDRLRELAERSLASARGARR